MKRILFIALILLLSSVVSYAGEYISIKTRSGQGFEVWTNTPKYSMEPIFLPGSRHVYLLLDEETFFYTRYSGSGSNYKLLPDGSWIIGPNAASIRIPYRYYPTSYYQKLYKEKNDLLRR
jgi:hypothetical protein